MAILDGLDGDVFDGLWLLFFMCVFWERFIYTLYLFVCIQYILYIHLFIYQGIKQHNE